MEAIAVGPPLSPDENLLMLIFIGVLLIGCVIDWLRKK